MLERPQTRPATVSLETSTGDRLTFREFPFSGKSFDSPIYYGYRAGYFFTEHFGVKAEFIHLKVHADLDSPVRLEGSLQGAQITGVAPMRRYADRLKSVTD